MARICGIGEKIVACNDGDRNGVYGMNDGCMGLYGDCMEIGNFGDRFCGDCDDDLGGDFGDDCTGTCIDGVGKEKVRGEQGTRD